MPGLIWSQSTINLRGGIPFGADEPQYTGAAGQTLVLDEDWESWATPSAALFSNGGRYLETGDINLVTLEDNFGNDPNADPGTNSGRAARFNWPALSGSAQADSGFDLGGWSPPFFPESHGVWEIVQLYWKAQQFYQWGNGKKFLLFFNEIDGNQARCRWTVNFDVCSITLSDGNFLHTDGEGLYGGGIFDFYPKGLTQLQWLGQGANYHPDCSVNGKWHRYTAARLSETNPGVSLDGQLHIWVDGEHCLSRGGPGQPLGTGGWSTNIQFMTVNNGNIPAQWDAYDNARAWAQTA